MAMAEETKVAILGGGVTGLCAAFYLAKAYGRDGVLLLEASDYVGGHTRTEHVDGFLCDRGSNGFLNREPLTLQWVENLGLSDRLRTANEAAAHRFILKNERLMEVIGPPKFLLTSLLSVRGRLRLMCEPLIKPKRDDAPESIWDFAARRIGREAADMMVSPMVTGIFGGDAHQLSLAHCFPRMAAMEREYGGLVKALIAKKRENKAASPIGPAGVLTSFDKGMGFLPESAAAKLADRIRPQTKVVGLRWQDGCYSVDTEPGMTIRAESVVVAVPAYAAAPIVAGLDDNLAQALDAIAYADILVICTGHRREEIQHDLNGFGFLVPRNQHKRVLGCIWTSSLFPNQAPKDWALLRTMYGGYTDPEVLNLSDLELMDYLKKEVGSILGFDRNPELIRIYRHKRGIPQYLLDHEQHMETIEAAERRFPGLVFAGNAYRGVGLNDCVVSAHRAITQLTGTPATEERREASP